MRLSNMLKLVVLAIVLFPVIAFGQEPAGDTNIITPVAPPADTNWYALVAAGVGIVVGITSAIRIEAPKIDGRLVYALVIPITIAVAVYQVGFSDVKLLAKHTGMVFLWSVGGTAGAKKFIGWVARGAIAVAQKEEWPTAPKSDPPLRGPESGAKPPKLPPVLPILCLALLGCGLTPLQGAIITADAMADSVNAAAPILREQCVEPMQVAALAGDKPRGQALAAKCDVPVTVYEAVRLAHVALSGAIVDCAAGKCSTLASALSVAVRTVVKLAPAIAELVGSTAALSVPGKVTQ